MNEYVFCNTHLGHFIQLKLQMLIMINDLAKTKIYPKFHRVDKVLIRKANK